jgi:hypothetical protein
MSREHYGGVDEQVSAAVLTVPPMLLARADEVIIE